MTTGPTTAANPSGFQKKPWCHRGVEPTTLRGADTIATPTIDILEVARKRLGDDVDVDFLRETLASLLQALMEAEVTTQAGATYGERSPARLSQRNGSRERRWDTRVGTLELAIPKLRSGSYYPPSSNPAGAANRPSSR